MILYCFWCCDGKKYENHYLVLTIDLVLSVLCVDCCGQTTHQDSAGTTLMFLKSTVNQPIDTPTTITIIVTRDHESTLMLAVPRATAWGLILWASSNLYKKNKKNNNKKLTVARQLNKLECLWEGVCCSVVTLLLTDGKEHFHCPRIKLPRVSVPVEQIH